MDRPPSAWSTTSVALRVLVWLAVLVTAPGLARAQGLVTDVFSGKLINPEVGVFAWYDLTDKTTDKRYFLRQAIVGKERVNRKTGYWLETELIPQVGFPTVYKMLLTGPANDPKNIHQVVVKEGERPPEVVPIPAEPEDGIEKRTPKEKRESLGMEAIETPQGDLKAEHVVITRPADKEGAPEERLEVWLNNSVRPMGIVRMAAPEGELVLRRYGKGGPDARSTIMTPPRDQGDVPSPPDNVEVRIEDSVSSGTGD